MLNRKKIKDVFTPRNHDVNHAMYIHRAEIERLLERKIDGTKHIIIYGESGSGKSWLYKKMLSDKKIKYGLINLANARRMGSITNIFNYELAHEKGYEKTGYTDGKKANANLGVFGGGLENENQYSKMIVDPIRDYIKLFKEQDCIIILDNLESIFNDPELMDELGDILTLLDDADYNTKFIIVGVPSEVIQYFSNRTLLKTVANRLTELPEVIGLNEDQVREFIEKGFIEELKLKLTDKELKKYQSIYFGLLMEYHKNSKNIVNR